MLNLEELVFKVNTKELVDAVTDLQNLGKAVSDLGTKSATINAKVNKTTAEVKTQAKAVKEATEETNKSTAALQRQQDILSFMTQGFSKGQSSVLAYAKAAGAATSEITELGKVLDRQRTLMGTDPFDKSIGAMKALRNEYTVLREVNRLYNAELNLSKNQMNELAREKLRLIEKLKIEGRSFTDVKNALRDLNIAYIQNANAENTLDANMRRRQKTVQDTAKANEYLAKEMERVNRMLNSTESITSTTNNKLIRFEQELKRSGMTAAQQTVALEKYKKALLDIQQAGGNRQVDYLSRALGPQITDVFVGLATGQSPLMVLLQQGGQLRDQFALAGVAGADMGKMLTTAAASMITSVKDVAMAVGGLLLNAIVATGKAIVNLPVQILKSAVDSLSGMFTFVKSGGKDTSALAESFGILSANLSKAALYAGGFAAALGIAFIAATKNVNELNRNLVMTGASLGLTAKDAYSLAQSMDASGVSTFKAVNALSAFAKEGVRPADGALKDLIKTAVELESVGGPSVEKTAEKLAEIGKSPVEALSKFAMETGVVDVAILKQVQSLEKQKKYTEAAELAQRSFIEGSKELSATMIANLTPVEKLWINIKKATSDAWSEVKEFANSDTFITPFKLALETVWVLISEFWYVLKAIGTEIGGITAQFSAMGEAGGVFTQAGRDAWSAVGEEMRTDAEKARKEQDAYIKSIIDGTIFQNKEMKKTGQQLRDNSDAARNFMKELKDKDGKTASGSLGAASDNSIANIEKRFNIQLQLAKNFAKDELDIQKAKLDTGLITQEEYYSNTVGLITESEQKQLAVVEQFSSEYEKAVQDRMLQLADALNLTFKNNKGLKEETVKNAEATEQYGQAVENVLTSLGTFQEKMQAIKDAAKSSAMMREFQAVAKLHKALQDSTEALRKYSEESTKIKEDADKELRNLDLRVTLMGKTEEEQKAINREWALQNRLTEIQLNLERRLREIRNDPKLAGNAMDSAVAEYEAIEAAKQQRIAANREVAVSAAEDFQKEFNRIRDSLSDAIVTALFEGGQAGKKKLRDLLVAELKKPITLYINAMVTTFMQDVLGMGKGSGSTAGGFGNKLGSGFSTSGIGSAITSVGNFTGISGLSNFGTGFGLGSSGVNAMSVMGEAISPMMNLGGLVADAIPYIGWAMLAIDLAKKFKSPGEQHTGAMVSTRGSELDMATAMSITGGREDASRDLTKRFNADLAKGIKPLVEGALSGTNSALAAIGLGGYTIDAGFAANTNGKGKDKNAFGYFNLYDAAGTLVKEYVNRELGTDLQEALTKFGGDIEEAVSSIALSGTDLRKEGETNADALKRVSEALLGANKWLDVLNHNLFETSIKGAEAAGALSELFGGTANMESALSSYYDKFYSEEEKTENIIRKLTTEFEKLGEPIPANIKKFKELVAAQDLNTEAGRKTYATLIGLSDAFYEVNQEADGVKTSVENALDDAFSALESAVKREQDMISKRISAIESTRNALSKLFDVLSKATRELYGSVDSTKGALVGQARQFITDSVAAARSGGGLPDADKMSEAIGTVRTGISDTLYATRFEEERDTLMLAGELFELQGYAGEELTNAELQLKELKDQSEQMELMLESYRVQIDLAKNLDVSVLSVADAIRQMEQTLADILDPTGAKRGKPQSSSSSAMSAGSAYGSSGPTTDSYSMTASAADIFGGHLMNSVTNRTEYEQAQVYLNAISSTGLGSADAVAAAMAAAGATPEQIAQAATSAAQYQEYVAATGGAPSSASAFLESIGADNPYAWMNLPSYDVGTNYVPRDMVAKIHEGEAIVPKRYNPDAGGESKIEALEAGLVGMRAELQAIALSSDKTRRLLERVTQDGNSLLVTDTATL